MKTRRIYLVLLIVVLIATLVLFGTVIAYMFQKTQYKHNPFTPAKVSCEVSELFDGQQKSSIQIKNTGNIDAYLRVRFVSYWVDTEGNIVAKPSEMPEIALASDWVKGSNNTYYYQSPVAPGKPTGELLSSPIFLEQDSDGYLQVVEIFGEAIQGEPRRAVINSWKVTLDTNGYITAAP